MWLRLGPTVRRVHMSVSKARFGGGQLVCKISLLRPKPYLTQSRPISSPIPSRFHALSPTEKNRAAAVAPTTRPGGGAEREPSRSPRPATTPHRAQAAAPRSWGRAPPRKEKPKQTGRRGNGDRSMVGPRPFPPIPQIL
jgi:hypothetical protein